MQKALPIGKAFLFSTATKQRHRPHRTSLALAVAPMKTGHRLRYPALLPPIQRADRLAGTLTYLLYLLYSLAGALIATGGFVDACSSLLFTLSIQRRRIGASRNFAATAAAMLITAAAMNTRSQ